MIKLEVALSMVLKWPRAAPCPVSVSNISSYLRANSNYWRILTHSKINAYYVKGQVSRWEMMYRPAYRPDTSHEWTTEIFAASFSTRLQQHPFQLARCNLQHFALLCAACSTMIQHSILWSELWNPGDPFLWLKEHEWAHPSDPA